MHGVHQPVGDRVQNEPDLVGKRLAASCSIRAQLRLMQLDKIFTLSAGDHRECHRHGAPLVSERQILALSVDGFKLDRHSHAVGRQRLPPPQGIQAAQAPEGRAGLAHGENHSAKRTSCSNGKDRITSFTTTRSAAFQHQTGHSPLGTP